MAETEKSNTTDNVIYLASCAVNGVTPDVSTVESMDLDDLYRCAQRHLLTGIIAYALERAGVRDSRFIQARAKAIRKNMIMQADMDVLFEHLDKACIWYMPLKGSLMDRMYPAAGTRQMSDRDILIDDSRAEDVKVTMEGLGFTTEHYGTGNHDVYYKQPVSNFEIHRKLFDPYFSEEIYDYYRDVTDKLLRDKKDGFECHFSDEDAYIYMITHEYKHYIASGTGLRSLLDIYVYCSHLGSLMDWNYIKDEVEKLGISEFEKTNRNLAMHMFGKTAEKGFTINELNNSERKMLDYVVGSGTYGTIENRVMNKVNKLGGGRSGKIKYVLNRLFPPMNSVKKGYPFFYRHKVLMPFLPIVRISRGLIVNRVRVSKELKALKKREK